MDYKQQTLTKAYEFAKQELSMAEPGHDWWHAVRVKNMALKIAKTEGGDVLIIELSSLLHDIADSKFCSEENNSGLKKVSKFLKTNITDDKINNQIIHIIKNISFSTFDDSAKSNTVEFSVVQDADRLDAIGAIGIARTFSYGGYKKRVLYNPQIPPILNMTTTEYKKNSAPTINHFYEKLLLLKDKMNTKTAQEIAKKRHDFLELFLEQFYAEWNCKL